MYNMNRPYIYIIRSIHIIQICKIVDREFNNLSTNAFLDISKNYIQILLATICIILYIIFRIFFNVLKTGRN